MAAFWRRGKTPVETPKTRPAVCVSGEAIETNGKDIGLTFDNANITTAGITPWLDYRAIL